MAETRKKVEYEVIIKRHGIFAGETDEDVAKEVQKQADYMFYQNSDSCETRITKCEDME